MMNHIIRSFFGAIHCRHSFLASLFHSIAERNLFPILNDIITYIIDRFISFQTVHRSSTITRFSRCCLFWFPSVAACMNGIDENGWRPSKQAFMYWNRRRHKHPCVPTESRGMTFPMDPVPVHACVRLSVYWNSPVEGNRLETFLSKFASHVSTIDSWTNLHLGRLFRLLFCYSFTFRGEFNCDRKYLLGEYQAAPN